MPRRGFAFVSLLLAALLAGLPPAAHAQTIVAVVNDAVVTDLEVEERVRLALAVTGQPATAANADRLRPQVLRSLIDERLQVQEATRLGLLPQEETVDGAIADVAERNDTTPDAFLSQFERLGVHRSTVRRQIEAQLAWIEVIRRQLAPRAVVSDALVDQTLDRLAAGERQLRLAELFLPIYSPDQEARVMQDADRLRQAIQSGADFEGLAQQFSAAPSAERGGELGWVPVSRLPAELTALLDALPDGGVTRPIRGPEGVFLFRRLGQRAAGERGEVDEQTRQQVERRLREEAIDRLASRYLRNLRQDAFIDLRV